MIPITPSIGVPLRLDALGYHTPAGRALLENVSLSLQTGERLAVVGPNGAGKSTLLRLLAGSLSPTTGSVGIDGQDLHKLSIQERARQIAWLPQHNAADVRMRVRDFVTLGCLPHRSLWANEHIDQTVQESIRVCDLHELQNQCLTRLSGGERQRTNLARALAQRPRLLLLDEPTNHLDPRASTDLLSAVASLDITVVAVLHDLGAVPDWACKVAILSRGCLVACDTPTRALTPSVVKQVFAASAFYLPHPKHHKPMLVLDRSLHPVRNLFKNGNKHEEPIHRHHADGGPDQRLGSSPRLSRPGGELRRDFAI